MSKATRSAFEAAATYQPKNGHEPRYRPPTNNSYRSVTRFSKDRWEITNLITPGRLVARVLNHWSTVGQQLQRAGVTMRRGGPEAHPASTEQILELRDQGLTWPEIAEQVDMTISGAWSRHRRARPPKSQRLGRWQQVLADALDQNLAIGVRSAVADHLGRAPTRAELTAARRRPTASPRSVERACSMCRAPTATPMQAIATIWCWRSPM